MAVRIRLKRTGTRNKSCFRIVVMDQRSSRDGSAIEELGYYDPNSKNETINLERVEYWQSCGALASETVDAIIKRAKGGIKLADKVRVSKPSKKAVAKAKAAVAAEAKAKAAAEVAASESENNA